MLALSATSAGKVHGVYFPTTTFRDGLILYQPGPPCRAYVGLDGLLIVLATMKNFKFRRSCYFETTGSNEGKLAESVGRFQGSKIELRGQPTLAV